MLNSKDTVKNGSYFQEELSKLLNCQYYEALKTRKGIQPGYPGWSPNNVKRVIISPDGVAVEYHCKAQIPDDNIDWRRTNFGEIPCNIRIKFFDLEPATSYSILSSPEYKPMIKALGGNRVYSAIEEIILLTKSDYGLSLPKSELCIESIGVDGGVSVVDSLKRRYNRLYGIAIVNNVSLKELRANRAVCNVLRKSTYAGKSLIEYLQKNGLNIKVLSVNGNKGFQNMPNLQKYVEGVNGGTGYLMDGSTLQTYFKDRIEKYESLLVQKNNKYTSTQNNDDWLASKANIYAVIISNLLNKLYKRTSIINSSEIEYSSDEILKALGLEGVPSKRVLNHLVTEVLKYNSMSSCRCILETPSGKTKYTENVPFKVKQFLISSVLGSKEKLEYFEHYKEFYYVLEFLFYYIMDSLITSLQSEKHREFYNSWLSKCKSNGLSFIYDKSCVPECVFPRYKLFAGKIRGILTKEGLGNDKEIFIKNTGLCYNIIMAIFKGEEKFYGQEAITSMLEGKI